MEQRLRDLIALRQKAMGQLDALLAQRKAITDLVTREHRQHLSVSEDAEFRQLTLRCDAKQSEVEAFDARIADLNEQIERSGRRNESAINARKAQARVTYEPRAYSEGDGQSYLRDLILNARNLDPRGEATERLRRHAMDVESTHEYRDLDTTGGNGGYFVPPAHLTAKWAPLARAGRVAADLCNKQDLPSGTNVVTIPKVTSGTAVDFQATENTAIAEQDLDDNSYEARVRTIAGGQDVSLQLLEQSPIKFDEVVFGDLMADHAVKTDRAVLAGTGTNGQIKGIHNTAGIGTVAIAGGVTVEKFYGAIANAIQQMHTQRFMPPNVLVMHPRRWGWLTAALDDDKRPLVLPSGRSVNNIATLENVASQQVVGELQGLPVVTDPNIGTTYGGGEDPAEDVAYVLRSSDLLLYESGIRTRVLPEIGGKSLTVHLQVYSFLAFSAERYPQSVVEITGLTEPTFG